MKWSECCCGQHRGTRLVVSDRDSAMLTLVCRGLSNANIAKSLHLSAATVRGYLTALYARFAVSSRAELATRSIHYGLVDVSVWPPVATCRRCVPSTPVVAPFDDRSGGRYGHKAGSGARCG